MNSTSWGGTIGLGWEHRSSSTKITSDKAERLAREAAKSEGNIGVDPALEFKGGVSSSDLMRQ